MRRVALACSFLGSLIAAGCAPASAPDANEGTAAEAKGAIAFGSADTANPHTAVVALVIDAGGGYISSCSGTVVKVANGQGYVLTAAHCCNEGAPGIVVMANDYGNYAQQLFNPNPSPPVYKVVPGSVYYDAAYNQYDHDFCMLKFSGATASTPTIKLPTGSPDGLANGTAIEHVGYGMTNTNSNNSQRRTGTNNVGQLSSALIEYNQGNGTPGPCQGDSGGPTLIPAGEAQGSQTVVGVTSWGNSSSCSGASMGASSRVLSGIGSGKFITSFINDAPIGNQPGTATGNCDTCQQETLSPGGACASTYNACTSNSACSTLLNCMSNCTTQTCAENCWNAAGTSGQNAYNAILNCICNTGCPTECSTECGGSTSSSSSSSGGNCGLQSQDPTCNTCLTNSCCSQASACANNAACVSCLQSANPPASCNSNAQLNSLVSCLSGNCASQCGISSSSSSSGSTSSSSGSTSSSSGSTSASSSTSSSGSTSGGTGGGGTGTGGTGTGGAGTGGDSGNDPDQDSGCSVSGGAGSASTQGASFAGLLVALGLAFARRRRGA